MNVAFVVLAHDQPSNVARLVRKLTEAKCATVVHFDAKAGSKPVEIVKELTRELSPLVVWPQRVSVGWGEWSMVEATLNSVRALLKAGHTPDFIHLMSGADYPLRPISDFIDFLARHRGNDFIESHNAQEKEWVLGGFVHERYRYRHFFNWRKHKKLFDINWRLQKSLRLHRRLPLGLSLHIGSQWCTLTAESWKKILEFSSKREVQSAFKYSWIPDEMYFHTLLAKFGLPQVQKHLTLYQFSEHGVPLVFYDDHIGYLDRQPFFFCRKLSPYANRLRDVLDSRISGRVRIRAFEDHQYGIVTSDYQNFLEQKKHENLGRRTPGMVRDAWAGELDWNIKPFIVVIGERRAEISEVLKQMASLSGLLVHGHLFAENTIEFANERTAFAGYRNSDVKLRDNSCTTFLSSVLMSGGNLITVFGLAFEDGKNIADRLLWHTHAHTILIKGNALCAALEKPDYKRDGFENSASLLFNLYGRILNAHDEKWSKLRDAKSKFVELQVYKTGWRSHLSTFLLQSNLRNPQKLSEELSLFACDTQPLFTKKSKEGLDPFTRMLDVLPNMPFRERLLDEMFQKSAKDFLVIASFSSRKLASARKQIADSGCFDIIEMLFTRTEETQPYNNADAESESLTVRGGISKSEICVALEAVSGSDELVKCGWVELPAYSLLKKAIVTCSSSHVALLRCTINDFLQEAFDQLTSSGRRESIGSKGGRAVPLRGLAELALRLFIQEYEFRSELIERKGSFVEVEPNSASSPAALFGLLQELCKPQSEEKLRGLVKLLCADQKTKTSSLNPQLSAFGKEGRIDHSQSKNAMRLLFMQSAGDFLERAKEVVR